MHSLEKKITPREERFLNPSFSSTLLDKIYRSIDDGERKSTEMKFYRETPTTVKKLNRSNVNYYNNRKMVEDEQGRGNDKKVGTQRPCFLPSFNTSSSIIDDRDHDQDVLFFSSTSISSDSSSGGFSSSDTESIMSRATCLAPPKPNPVMKKKNNNNEKQAATTTKMLNGICHNSKKEGVEVHDEKALFKSKLRALKIYNNLKKVKQPISPGGRLTTFLNSLFANAKKSKSSSSFFLVDKSSSSCYYGEDMKSEMKLKSKAFSTCSSAASSFSRSCLSKTYSSEREKIFNGVKRTVSVIMDEENRPCGHKCLYEEEKTKLPVLEKRKVVENDLVSKNLPLRINNNVNVNQQGFKLRSITTTSADDNEEEDDDAASYASSDLFELDHLSVLGNGRYCEEIPVYETTHVSKNRAIANGLII